MVVASRQSVDIINLQIIKEWSQSSSSLANTQKITLFTTTRFAVVADLRFNYSNHSIDLKGFTFQVHVHVHNLTISNFVDVHVHVYVIMSLGWAKMSPTYNVNHSYGKITVLMYVHVCVYVCMYVPIRRPCAHHVHVCAPIDTVKIINVDCVLLDSKCSSPVQNNWSLKEGLFEPQADLEETRKRKGRGSVPKSSIFL